MRVLQVIDSLQLGGAERMAVNYANALVGKIDASYLCATREEGDLKDEISDEVGYLFLDRKSTLDFNALRRLLKFIKKNMITVIHAHSSSWFISACAKMLSPGVKLVWHDHYGNSENLELRPSKFLRIFSHQFDMVFTVNDKLKKWGINKLSVKRIFVIQNFIKMLPYKEDYKRSEYFNIIHVANFRPQKNHIFLLNCFKKIVQEYPSCRLHLYGKNFNDEYSSKVLSTIEELELIDVVTVHQENPNISENIYKYDLGVLSSISEGLPLALLEYGMAGLPVVVTDVGQCRDVVGEFGALVPSNSINKFISEIIQVIENKSQAELKGSLLRQHVLANFSKESIITGVVEYYSQI